MPTTISRRSPWTTFRASVSLILSRLFLVWSMAKIWTHTDTNYSGWCTSWDWRSHCFSSWSSYWRITARRDKMTFPPSLASFWLWFTLITLVLAFGSTSGSKLIAQQLIHQSETVRALGRSKETQETLSMRSRSTPNIYLHSIGSSRSSPQLDTEIIQERHPKSIFSQSSFNSSVWFSSHSLWVPSTVFSTLLTTLKT